MAEITTQNFIAASRLSIKDPDLRIALERVGTGFDGARRDAIQEVGEDTWEGWRTKAQEIKAHTIDHLDYYLDLLYENVTKSGGFVHFAKDAAQANSIVCELVQSNDIKVATKSKSMVSEELGLNHVLESVGVDVYETDLGEYIIQLAEETPSHLVAPALHKTRGQVATLFQEKLGIPYNDDIEQMAKTAREVLREKFLTADLGISGANFLIAETGSLVIITNEGNGRLCTSAPRIHIGITGMEKVIPSLEDLPTFLRLLPRSATGQRLTSYVSMVTGPRRNSDEDGPEQFHIIIVDNGRSKMLADPKLREALYCIRCGACLNICPVYQKVGGHAYGWVYPGPIGSIVTPNLTKLQDSKDLPFASSLCGACKEACPVKINIPRMLLHLRQNLVEPDDNSKSSAGLPEIMVAKGYKNMMKHPALIRLSNRILGTIQKPLMKQGVIKSVPIPPFSKWTRARDLPSIPKRTFHEIWATDLKNGKDTHG